MDSTGPGVDTSQSVRLLRKRDRRALSLSLFALCFFG